MFTGKERLRLEKENWEWFQVPWERRDLLSEAKGNPGIFLNSCSHGAGRVMSRAAAYRNLKKRGYEEFLRAREVTLIGGTLDESPEVYKDINKVIAGQTDLVDVLAKV